MGNILVTGIPSVGKKELSDIAVQDSMQVYGKPVSFYSQSDVMLDIAKRLWNTASLSQLDYSLQQSLRELAITELSHSLKRGNANILVNMPVTVRTHGVPNVNCSSRHVSALHSARPFDYVVTVIDNPNNVTQRRNGRESVDEILDWTAYEVDFSRVYADMIRVPHITIPRQHSERTLTILLNDENPPICYLAGPITSLKEREGDSRKQIKEKKAAKQAMSGFREDLKNYCIVVAPMELADSGTTRREVENTVFRDLHWFVRQAHFTLAYFPGEYPSTGTFEEMRQTSRVGKRSILVHPGQNREVFGFRPNLHYHDAKKFFRAVRSGKVPLLEGLMRDGTPRYSGFNTRK